jgi:hypothetical protein
MHYDLQGSAIDVDFKVVVVDFLALEEVVLGAVNWICVRSRAARHNIFASTFS